MAIPELIETEDQLDRVLSTPSAELEEAIGQLQGPIIILGAGGKMGPSLALLARRAAAKSSADSEVIAVSRFTNPAVPRQLETEGVKTISCDLFQRESLKELPDARHVIYLVGQKFGTQQNPGATWAVNTLIPEAVVARYPHAKIVALSTGNVYPLTSVDRGGAIEIDPLTPLGEYPNAAVARERIFEFCSRQHGTPIVLLRLFYALDLRYGVLVDIAQKVAAGEAIDITTGFFNCIWQGDANEMILRSLRLATAPPAVFNLCHPQIFSVRQTAEHLGQLLGRPPVFSGAESKTALLGNAGKISALLGAPRTPTETILKWTAHWVKKGGRNLGKPTHFEVRDGKY